MITSGGGSRWDAICSVSWPEAFDALYVFHSPLRIFTHRTLSRKVSKRFIRIDTERLALDAAVPVEYLVSAALAANHVDAIEGTPHILAAARAEFDDQDDLASRLLAASRQFDSALPDRARALREIVFAVLSVKREGIRARRKAVKKAQRAAIGINHADLWSFVLAALYAGEFEGWTHSGDSERAARAAYKATPDRKSVV